MNNEPYNQIDHSHCWEQDKPACGQRIVHFECCLCKKVNPKVFEFIKKEIDHDRKVLLDGFSHPKECEECKEIRS